MLVKRKGTFLSLSSLAREILPTLSMCTRSIACACAEKIVHSRDAQCSAEESPYIGHKYNTKQNQLFSLVDYK